MAFNVTAADQVEHGAYGRAIQPGTYPGYVLNASQEVTKKGDPAIKLTIVADPPADKGEGKTKMDFYVVKNSWTLLNFIEVFAPAAKDKDFSIDADTLAKLGGSPLRVMVKMRSAKLNPDKSVQYEARADISRLLPAEPGQARVAVPAAAELPF